MTEENLQARIRGTLLMALSNKFGWLVLATGNKSEISVGYSTLYGDLAGGFALIKDVHKTVVYQLVRWRNSADAAAHGLSPSGGSRSPDRSSSVPRRPSCAHEQRDEDSLPPYPILDRMFKAYVELDRSREQLVDDGFPETDVDRTLAMIDRAEYKRRQAPPGIKLHHEGLRPRPADADHEPLSRLTSMPPNFRLRRPRLAGRLPAAPGASRTFGAPGRRAPRPAPSPGARAPSAGGRARPLRGGPRLRGPGGLWGHAPGAPRRRGNPPSVRGRQPHADLLARRDLQGHAPDAGRRGLRRGLHDAVRELRDRGPEHRASRPCRSSRLPKTASGRAPRATRPRSASAVAGRCCSRGATRSRSRRAGSWSTSTPGARNWR